MINLTLVGRLVGEVNAKETANGDALVTFSLSVYKGGKDDDKYQFYNCISWKPWVIELIKNRASKGDNIALNGRITSRKYINREGNQVERWEVTVEHAEEVLVPRGTEPTDTPRTTRAAPQPPADDEFDPFADD